MYEDTPFGLPIASGIYNRAESYHLPIVQAERAWQDLQGPIRFWVPADSTASIQFVNVTIRAHVPAAGGGTDVYETFHQPQIPVPEPSSLMLFTGGSVLIAGLWLRRRFRRERAAA